MHTIAQLATGSELVQGDLLNTNSQTIAKALHQHGLALGQQLIVDDDQSQITTALNYLLERHDVVITIGGLGPTSDDVTRFAIADAVEQPLTHDDKSWQHIHTRITQLGYNVTENNRHQALFPKTATIFPNPNGTANACLIEKQGKVIFMLPGPPNECLPLFHSQVLPWLKTHCQFTMIYRHYWYLFRVSESIIADKVTRLLGDHQCQIGYRVHYPYLQLKLASDSKPILTNACETLWPLIEPHLIGDGQHFASELLCLQPVQLTIFDSATRGHLQAALTTPITEAKFTFTNNAAEATIKIVGFLF